MGKHEVFKFTERYHSMRCASPIVVTHQTTLQVHPKSLLFWLSSASC